MTPEPRLAGPRRRSLRAFLCAVASSVVLMACATDAGQAPAVDGAPQEVRMTYFGISNWTFRIGRLNILMDGYMTRIPQGYFSGGGGGLARTTAAYPIDRVAVVKANRVLAGSPAAPINLIFTGHSHFDHSFDTPYWAKLTGAKVIGSQTTCYQLRALGVPQDQCAVVNGGETIRLDAFTTVRVVRWNHSGTHETNPEQHDPVELTAVPTPDAGGNLRGGVAEDFPNGGGNRGYLFTVRTSTAKALTFFVTNSASATDLAQDIVVDGLSFGSPLAGLSKAMADARLTGVDVWFATGGVPVAQMTLPLVKPKVYVANHLGNFFAPIEAGMTAPLDDQPLVRYLQVQNVELVAPAQYFDAFVLDANGFRAVDNAAMKAPYGFR